MVSVSPLYCFPFLSICFDPLGLAGGAVASHTHRLSLKPSSSAKREAGCGSRLSILWLCKSLDHYQQNWMPPAEKRTGELKGKFFFTFSIKDGCLDSLKGGKSYLDLRAGQIREDYSLVESSLINITVTFVIRFCSILGRKIFPLKRNIWLKLMPMI